MEDSTDAGPATRREVDGAPLPSSSSARMLGRLGSALTAEAHKLVGGHAAGVHNEVLDALDLLCKHTHRSSTVQGWGKSVKSCSAPALGAFVVQ